MNGHCQLCGASRKIITRPNNPARRTYQSTGLNVINQHSSGGRTCPGSFHPPIENSCDVLRQHVAKLSTKAAAWHPSVSKGTVTVLTPGVSYPFLKDRSYIAVGVRLPCPPLVYANNLERELQQHPWEGRIYLVCSDLKISLLNPFIANELRFTRQADATKFRLLEDTLITPTPAAA